jgi:hypothetical protein
MDTYGNSVLRSPLPHAAPLTGSYLDHLLKDATVDQKGEIGAQLVIGELRPLWLTPAQAARLVGTAAWVIHQVLEHPTVAPMPVHSVGPTTIDGEVA